MADENVCYFNKFGHCKYLDTCRNRHLNIICENADCEVQRCSKRHPRDCIFFRKFRRCKFGDYCSYKHCEILNSENCEITILKSKVEALEKLLEQKDRGIESILETISSMSIRKEFETKEPSQESEEESKPKHEAEATKTSLHHEKISEALAVEEKSKPNDASNDELEHDDNVNQLRAAQYFQLKPYKCNLCGSRYENIENQLFEDLGFLKHSCIVRIIPYTSTNQ